MSMPDNEAHADTWLRDQILERLGTAAGRELWEAYRDQARRTPGDDFFFLDYLTTQLAESRRPTLKQGRRMLGIIQRMAAELRSLTAIGHDLRWERSHNADLVERHNAHIALWQEMGIKAYALAADRGHWRAAFRGAELVPCAYPTPEEAIGALIGHLEIAVSPGSAPVEPDPMSDEARAARDSEGPWRG